MKSDRGETETDETAEQDVATFRIAIVAELGPREAFRTGPRAEPSALAISRANFGEVMSELCASFAVDVPDPLEPSAPPLRVDLRLGDLKALRPDGLVDAVAPLRALAEGKRLLEEARRAGRTGPELRAHLARVLPRESWAAALVGTSPSPTAPAPAAPPAAAPSAIDDLLDRVDVTAPAEPTAQASGRDPVSALVSAVARSARASNRPNAPARDPAPAANASATLVQSLLVHPEVRRLERLWRSVKLLVDAADPRAGVEVYVVAVADEEIEPTLDAFAESDSGAFDLLVLGDELAPTAASLARARHAASVGESMNTAVLVSGTPELVGATDLPSLGRTLRKLSTVDDPRAVATRAAAADEAMRWLFVTLNGPLVRGPYDAENVRAKGLGLAQDPNDPTSWVAALPAFALAALTAKSFSKTGWPTPVTAPSTTIDGLVVRESSERGTSAGIVTDAFVSDDAARELAQAGIIAFGAVPNRDSAYVLHAPCMYRPKGPVAKAAEGSLADSLFVGSLVRALRELGDLVPEGTPNAKVGQVAEVVLRDLWHMAAPPGPEISCTAKGGTLAVRVRPHRFAGVGLEEITLGVPLR